MEPDSQSNHEEIVFKDRRYLVDFDKIDLLSKRIQEFLGVQDFELSVNIVSPEEMQDLNQQFRDKDRSTDVLSFPQEEFVPPITTDHPFQDEISSDAPPKLLGDIAISLIDAEQNAKSIGQGLDRELCFLLVHGILHLCGHDHLEPEEEKVMLQQQKKIMEKLEDSEPPPAIWNQCARSQA